MTQISQPNLLSAARALTAAALLAATAVAVAPTSTSANASYDGVWSVLIVTQKGSCDRAYRYPVKITNGAVGYNGEATAFTVSGKVEPTGAVKVSVARGSQRADGAGRLSATTGNGLWTGGECAGTWTAERRS
jgi:hypothetical protein